MRNIISVVSIILLVGGVFFTLKNTLNIAKADTGGPVTISATYNSSTNELTASGTWSFPACPKDNKGVGFAIFTNGAKPDDTVDSLDGTGMHQVQVPCTSSSGSWGTDTHTLDEAPSSVCVVIYDVHSDDVGKTSGHNDMGDGSNRNEDNSYESKDWGDGSYPSGSCTEPTIITPSETPTPTPGEVTPTPTPTPGGGTGGTGDGRSDGLGCGSHDCSNQGGQVLGTSTQSVLGLSTTSSGGNIYLSLVQLAAAMGLAGVGFKYFRKHA